MGESPINFRLRILIAIVAAFAALAPVCVLAGGSTATKPTEKFELSNGAHVEVIGENAEVRVHGVTTDTLELTVTLNNAEFVDYFTQSFGGDPASHLVISANVSAGGTTTANSVIEIGIPAGIELTIRTTNRAISVDAVSISTAILATSNGKITVANSSGDFDLNTTNSEVTVQGVDGPVNIVTTNASVWFEGVVDEGSNSISTTNGDIVVRLKNGSNVAVSGNTRNGDVTVNGGSDGVARDGDRASISYRVDVGVATLHLTNGPGAIHVNPPVIAVFDGES